MIIPNYHHQIFTRSLLNRWSAYISSSDFHLKSALSALSTMPCENIGMLHCSFFQICDHHHNLFLVDPPGEVGRGVRLPGGAQRLQTFPNLVFLRWLFYISQMIISYFYILYFSDNYFIYLILYVYLVFLLDPRDPWLLVRQVWKSSFYYHPRKCLSVCLSKNAQMHLSLISYNLYF